MDIKKIAAGVILLPFFLLLIGWGATWMLLGVVVLLAIGLGTWEYTKIAFGEGAIFQSLLGWLCSGIVCILTGTLYELPYIMASLAGSFLFISIAFMLREPDLSQVLINASKTFFGVVFIGYFGGMVVALKGLEASIGGFKLVILLFALIWINDAGAYFAGTKFGKRKIAPNLSPNKTIEGSAGGFFATLLLALGLGLFTDFATMKEAMVLGVIMGIIGPLGDLFESALKRGADVKDSGNLIPGHGGVLDRIDSVLFGAPILYFFVLFRYLG